MEAALRILEHDRPDDFVIATGESHSVRELAETAAAELGMRIEWRGKGLDEVGIDAETGRTIIRIDPKYFRPAEVDWLQGDASKARELLGWAPQTSFRDLVSLMVKSDEALVRSRKGDVS
jgi:GDPmannose 4,6-dehydratase